MPSMKNYPIANTMTTPTPIRELCAKATKGPWSVAPAFPGDKTIEIKELALAIEDDDVTPDDAKRNYANAELIARLNPQTVLMVVEALEAAHDALQHWSFVSVTQKHYNQLKESKASINDALRALNGQRDGGAE